MGRSRFGPNQRYSDVPHSLSAPELQRSALTDAGMKNSSKAPQRRAKKPVTGTATFPLDAQSSASSSSNGTPIEEISRSFQPSPTSIGPEYYNSYMPGMNFDDSSGVSDFATPGMPQDVNNVPYSGPILNGHNQQIPLMDSQPSLLPDGSAFGTASPFHTGATPLDMQSPFNPLLQTTDDPAAGLNGHQMPVSMSEVPSNDMSMPLRTPGFDGLMGVPTADPVAAGAAPGTADGRPMSAVALLNKREVMGPPPAPYGLQTPTLPLASVYQDGSAGSTVPGPIMRPASTGSGSSSSAPAKKSSKARKPLHPTKTRPAFVMKLWNMVNDPANEEYIRWMPDGKKIQVVNRDQFEKVILPKYFKHSNFSSFVRQLNMYGWHKVQDVSSGSLQPGDEIWQFHSPYFIKGREDLLDKIVRNKGSKGDEEDEEVDMSYIVSELKQIKANQIAIWEDLRRIRADNELLWKENYLSRERHKTHEETLQKIMRFLASVYGYQGKILDSGIAPLSTLAGPSNAATGENAAQFDGDRRGPAGGPLATGATVHSDARNASGTPGPAKGGSGDGTKAEGDGSGTDRPLLMLMPNAASRTGSHNSPQYDSNRFDDLGSVQGSGNGSVSSPFGISHAPGNMSREHLEAMNELFAGTNGTPRFEDVSSTPGGTAGRSPTSLFTSLNSPHTGAGNEEQGTPNRGTSTATRLSKSGSGSTSSGSSSNKGQPLNAKASESTTPSSVSPSEEASVHETKNSLRGAKGFANNGNNRLNGQTGGVSTDLNASAALNPILPIDTGKALSSFDTNNSLSSSNQLLSGAEQIRGSDTPEDGGINPPDQDDIDALIIKPDSGRDLTGDIEKSTEGEANQDKMKDSTDLTILPPSVPNSMIIPGADTQITKTLRVPETLITTPIRPSTNSNISIDELTRNIERQGKSIEHVNDWITQLAESQALLGRESSTPLVGAVNGASNERYMLDDMITNAVDEASLFSDAKKRKLR